MSRSNKAGLVLALAVTAAGSLVAEALSSPSSSRAGASPAASCKKGPTVVFEAGQGGAGATSPLPGATTARAAVAKDTRVCAYDRAGLGASDPRPAGVAPTAQRYADEPCPQTCTYEPPEASTFDVSAATFGSRPVAVLVAEFGSGVDGRAFAKRSTNSILVTALGSSHAIINDKPDLVAAATRLVAASARTGTSLPPCSQSPLPAAGGRCETVG